MTAAMWFTASSARVDCFYCRSTLSLIPAAAAVAQSAAHRDLKGKGRTHLAIGTAHHFQCTVCECSNRRHMHTGEILVGDDAVHLRDPHSPSNRDSFAKRGTSIAETVRGNYPS